MRFTWQRCRCGIRLAIGRARRAWCARTPSRLELSADQIRCLTQLAVDKIVRHERGLYGPDACKRRYACRRGEDDLLAGELIEGAPEMGSPIRSLLDEYFDRYLPATLNTAAPGYLGYIPGGGLFPAALADFIAGATNRYTGIVETAPLLVQLEANALTWFRDWMQFPPSTRGLFTTGGSMANFNAIVCARESHLGSSISSGVIYTSTQAHHSIRKAARLAGIMPDRVVSVPVNRHYRMRVDDLERAIRRDRARGLVPFLVVTTAGTTNTGAVDPLEAVADVCDREGLWHHVDGAYGAFFHMRPELQSLLRGLPRADSLTLDPHKGLFLPYGTGALLVRDGDALLAAHASGAGYLPPSRDPHEYYDPHLYGPDLSRGFPGLRVWLTVKYYGTQRLRDAIAEKRELALEAACRIARCGNIVMDAWPQLSLFAFHVERKGSSVDEQNRATLELVRKVNDTGSVYLTGCWAGGRYLARVCVLSFRTHQEQIDACVAELENVV